MKHTFEKCKRGRAFTLVELLVVMGIIAILAGVVVASVGAAIRFAKRTKSQTVAVSLQTAVQSYYTEYGVYPTQANYPAAGDAYYTGAASSMSAWQNLMWALCGNINPITGATSTQTAPTNTRSVAFLAPSRSDLDANGVLVNPFGGTGTTVGSTYFYMAIDTDYSGVVGDAGDASGNIPNYTASTNVNANPKQPVTGGVAVWCPNDQPNTTSGQPSTAAFWAHTY